MRTSSKVLIGGLFAMNLALVGLLLFRDRSMAPANAESASPEAATALAEAGQPGDTSHEAEPIDQADAIQPAEKSPVLEQPRNTEPRRAASRPATTETRTAPSAPAPKRAESVPYEDAVRAERSRQAAMDRAAEPANDEPAYEPPVTIASRPVVATQDPARHAEPQPRYVTIPVGTRLPIRLDVGLNSRQVRTGDKFEASLAEDLVVAGTVLGRAGDAVTGRIVEVTEAGRVKGLEQMRINVVDLELSGHTYAVETAPGTFVARESKDRDAATVGGTTAVGAIIGAIAGGGKGAATGAAAGAAAGAGVVLSTKGKAVVIPSGERLEFEMTKALRVPAVPAGAPEDSEGDDNVARR